MMPLQTNSHQMQNIKCIQKKSYILYFSSGHFIAPDSYVSPLLYKVSCPYLPYLFWPPSTLLSPLLPPPCLSPDQLLKSQGLVLSEFYLADHLCAFSNPLGHWLYRVTVCTFSIFGDDQLFLWAIDHELWAPLVPHLEVDHINTSSTVCTVRGFFKREFCCIHTSACDGEMWSVNQIFANVLLYYDVHMFFCLIFNIFCLVKKKINHIINSNNGWIWISPKDALQRKQQDMIYMMITCLEDWRGKFLWGYLFIYLVSYCLAPQRWVPKY